MARGHMYFRVQARHLETGEISQVISPSIRQACFAAFTLRSMDSKLRVHELEWHYEKNDTAEHVGEGSSEEEFREMINHFFGEGDSFGLTVGFLGQSELHQDRNVVRFSNMENYPRNLFMGKLFVIRNLNRYQPSYKMFKKLLSVGVPFRYAMVIGATAHYEMGFSGPKLQFRGYARTMDPFLHTVADLRNSANNVYLGDVGATWGDPSEEGQGGYNVKYNNGIERSTHRVGYTNSPILYTVAFDNVVPNQGMGWKGMMRLVSAITGSKRWKEVKEPYVGYNQPVTK